MLHILILSITLAIAGATLCSLNGQRIDRQPQPSWIKPRHVADRRRGR